MALREDNTMGHRNIKRITRRVLEELRATKEIARVMSLKDALTTFRAKVDIQIMNHNGYVESEVVKKRLIRKHEIMLEYYNKTFGEFLNTYQYQHVTLEECDDSKIWVCWWQGLDAAPALVKRCVESIKKHAENHEVVILTEDNYKNYVDIPKWVEEKKEKGIITRTNYSDLLRLSLLAEHGGMWLDSTFFCTADVLSEYFKEDIWSVKRPDYFHASVASGYFAGYSWCCNAEHRWIFAIFRDFFLNYWKTNDMMVDYLMVDYMVALARKCDWQIEEVLKKIKPNNSRCDDLYKVLGCVYDEALWKEMQAETSLFKLSWKYVYPMEKDGKPTFYAKLIDGSL